MNQNILINNLVKVEKEEYVLAKNIFLVITGTLFLALMSQLTIPLQPVPVTGQTLAVMLIGLTYGKKLGASTLLSYITAGSLGLPVFAGFKSGFPLIFASGGYIIGFFFAALVCGYFADKGWTKSYIKLIGVLLIAHFVLYFFGLLQLKLFLPNKDVLAIGFIPFIAGDIIKMVLATLLLPTVWKFVKE